MKKFKKLIWKLYNKISTYDQSIRDEFEYELWKDLEKKYYEIYQKHKKRYDKLDKESAGDDMWSMGSALGEVIAYQCVWYNIYDRFFYVCERLDRMDEYKKLKKERDE